MRIQSQSPAYVSHISSAARFVAAYGLIGRIAGSSSRKGGVASFPYTLELDAMTSREIFAARAASSSTVVPSTFTAA